MCNILVLCGLFYLTVVICQGKTLLLAANDLVVETYNHFFDLSKMLLLLLFTR